jgi:hypothetical protein
MDLIAGVNGLGNRLANGGRAILHGLASCMAQPGRAAKEVVAAADTMLDHDARRGEGGRSFCVHPGAPVA